MYKLDELVKEYSILDKTLDLGIARLLFRYRQIKKILQELVLVLWFSGEVLLKMKKNKICILFCIKGYTS